MDGLFGHAELASDLGLGQTALLEQCSCEQAAFLALARGAWRMGGKFHDQRSSHFPSGSTYESKISSKTQSDASFVRGEIGAISQRLESFDEVLISTLDGVGMVEVVVRLHKHLVDGLFETVGSTDD
ncbi:hypothetical protein NOSIN_26185 [Nocardiopsis sinuspersici]|uniref:Uncharacterized protein n=1 Tax=Nocardiopsis sinuspersici TaxID=501010 RepID=A0A1V3BUP0_9ACTN|nr:MULTISPECIES: hypothetical protein [Nocardiopsis]OOC50891.1 hypothetical protein NOSIN_26185 [Nocardiopsis sinuspersici]